MYIHTHVYIYTIIDIEYIYILYTEVCMLEILDDLDDLDGLIHPFVVQEVARLDPASQSNQRMGGLSSRVGVLKPVTGCLFLERL